MKKRALVIEIISALLILLFIYTASSKLFDVSAFRKVLKLSPLIGPAAGYFAWLVPLSEILVSTLLFFPALRLKGLYASLGLMLAFTLYIGYMLLFEPDLPCSCGGVIGRMSWTQHFFFNIFFVLLSLWGIILYRKKYRIDRNEEPSLA